MGHKGFTNDGEIFYGQGDVQVGESEVSYTPTVNWTDRYNPSLDRSNDSPRRNQPKTLTPSIRKELHQANQSLVLASEAMLEAHQDDGVDVVQLANAIEEYRRCVELLWKYREFGVEAWQKVIVFSQQALAENLRDEDMTPKQCEGLSTLASEYLANRMLAPDDVREVMRLIKASGFDPLLFFSQPRKAE